MVRGGDLAGPLPVRAVEPGRVGVAAAVGSPAVGAPLGDRAGQHHAGAGDRRELRGDLGGFILMSGGDTHGPRLAHVPHFSHIQLYTYSVDPSRTASSPAPVPASARLAGELIARYRPSSLTPQEAARFARLAAAACAPRASRAGQGAAVCLRQAGGVRVGGRAGAGPAGVPASLGDRAVHRQRAGQLPDPTRRTLRTNLRYAARRAGPQLGSRAGAAAPPAGQGSLQRRGDRRVPGPGRCPADTRRGGCVRPG